MRLTDWIKRAIVKFMEIRPLEFSIVIVANDCNPTILNPDFLARQGIVPDDWGWNVSGPVIVTPPFATVAYDSGITVSVEINKFQVVDGLPGRMPDASQIPKVARKYIEVLPHVRYTAVGHNFKGFAELADATAFLTERFLKPGVWDSDKYPLKGVNLKFAYPSEGGRLNLTLDGATIEDRSGDEPKQLHGVLVQANFHRDCSGYPSHKQVIKHLGYTKCDWTHFQLTATEILG